MLAHCSLSQTRYYLFSDMFQKPVTYEAVYIEIYGLILYISVLIHGKKEIVPYG